ncbi:hypothetical protein IHE45_20G081900 [Dioscorea alata]|uniref:Uncharacterized protein n=1 Tax=Dioscorea alata TaxID=55571 RepID=A0ACB7TW70_DIOAL|nr:hypothetical protein IHE45_20G081900 [Dioscorea alata]
MIFSYNCCCSLCSLPPLLHLHLHLLHLHLHHQLFLLHTFQLLLHLLHSPFYLIQLISHATQLSSQLFLFIMSHFHFLNFQPQTLILCLQTLNLSLLFLQLHSQLFHLIPCQLLLQLLHFLQSIAQLRFKLCHSLPLFQYKCY